MHLFEWNHYLMFIGRGDAKSSLETSKLGIDTKGLINGLRSLYLQVGLMWWLVSETDNSKRGQKMSPRIGLRLQLFQRVRIIRTVCHQNFSCQLRNALSLNKKLSDLLKAMSDRDVFPAYTFAPEMPTYFRRLSGEMRHLFLGLLCICLFSY